MAPPDNLDSKNIPLRSHVKTEEYIINNFDAGLIWDDFGIRSDVTVRCAVCFGTYNLLFDCIQPFTTGFPRADIHELLSPDLLHQVIKGTFKDHLVDWVSSYLHQVHPERRANEILHDIDRR